MNQIRLRILVNVAGAGGRRTLLSYVDDKSEFRNIMTYFQEKLGSDLEGFEAEYPDKSVERFTPEGYRAQSFLIPE